MTHLHCSSGCQKVVFIERDGRLVCIRCGAEAENVPECWCLEPAAKGEQDA